MRLSRTACLITCGLWLLGLSSAAAQDNTPTKPASQPVATGKAQSQPSKAQSQPGKAHSAAPTSRPTATSQPAAASEGATPPANKSAPKEGEKPLAPRPENDPNARPKAAKKPPAGGLDAPKSRFSQPGAELETVAPAGRLIDMLTPEFSPASLAWIAVVLILTLTLQTRPLLTMHNLDALILAASAALVTLRSQSHDSVVWLNTDRIYLLLTIAGVYWLVRGLGLLLSSRAPALGANVNEGAMTVLVIAGLLIAFNHIANDPLSASSRDGLVGGAYMAHSGKLPYGVAEGYDARSPLLYAVHAGAMRVLPSSYSDGAISSEINWSDRAHWLNPDVWNAADLPTTRLVNAVLFLLALLGLAGIGHRQHSVALGQTIVALFCIFPGVIECVGRPDIMLPTALLAWSIAAIKIPIVGSFLSVALMLLAGIASPWTLLGIPPLLAYHLRQGWNALGGTLGLVGGVAAIAAGLTVATKPTLPRADGAISLAGMTATHTATFADGAIRLNAATSAPAPDNSLKARFWRFLIDRDELPVDTSVLPLSDANSGMLYRQLDARGEARARLQSSYASAIADAPPAMRFWAATRTVLESTWAPSVQPDQEARGVWDIWSASGKLTPDRWSLIRRIAKGTTIALALVVAFLLVRGERPQPHQLIGGLLAVCSLALLVSESGAVTNLAWLMPTALGALAVRTEPTEEERESGAAAGAGPRGPRITVER